MLYISLDKHLTFESSRDTALIHLKVSLLGLPRLYYISLESQSVFMKLTLVYIERQIYTTCSQAVGESSLFLVNIFLLSSAIKEASRSQRFGTPALCIRVSWEDHITKRVITQL